VNIASGLGKMAMPFAVSYSATKHGLVGATHALRAEYRGSGVGFSVICPGFVRDDGMYAVHEAGGAVAPRMAGRATPEKVANAVVRAITHDRPEIMVNSAPMRPLVLLMTAFPSLHAPLVKSLGLRRWGERAAAQQALTSQRTRCFTAQGVIASKSDCVRHAGWTVGCQGTYAAAVPNCKRVPAQLGT
jgi:hypothetical protein